MIFSIKITLQSLHPRFVNFTYESSRIIDCRRNTLILFFPFFFLLSPFNLRNIKILILVL